MSTFLGGGGLLLLIAGPVVFIWGFYRTVIFTGAQMAASIAEKEQGTSFANKQKKWGYYLMLAGIVFGVVGWIFFAYLQ